MQIKERRSLRFNGSQPIPGIGPKGPEGWASRGFISKNIRSKAIATTLTIRNKVFIVEVMIRGIRDNIYLNITAAIAS